MVALGIITINRKGKYNASHYGCLAPLRGQIAVHSECGLGATYLGGGLSGFLVCASFRQIEVLNNNGIDPIQ
jgi:hypothetical protein